MKKFISNWNWAEGISTNPSMEYNDQEFLGHIGPTYLRHLHKIKFDMELVLSPLALSEKIGDPDQIRTGDLSLDRAVC